MGTLETAQVATSGQSLTLTLPVTFKQTFIGSKNIYLSAEDKTGLTSGSKSHGTGTPAQNQNPANVAIWRRATDLLLPARPRLPSRPVSRIRKEKHLIRHGGIHWPAAAGSGAAITRKFNCEDAGNHTITAHATQ